MVKITARGGQNVCLAYDVIPWFYIPRGTLAEMDNIADSHRPPSNNNIPAGRWKLR